MNKVTKLCDYQIAVSNSFTFSTQLFENETLYTNVAILLLQKMIYNNLEFKNCITHFIAITYATHTQKSFFYLVSLSHLKEYESTLAYCLVNTNSDSDFQWGTNYLGLSITDMFHEISLIDESNRQSNTIGIATDAPNKATI